MQSHPHAPSWLAAQAIPAAPRRTRRLAGRTIAVCLVAAVIVPQTAWGVQDDSNEVAATQAPAALEGFWPSRNMIRLVIGRFVDETRSRYELTDEQVEQWSELSTKRWTEYADKNRADLQPLINEFIEMRMEMEPPSGERIQGWATQMNTAFDGLRAEMAKNIDEVREILDPLQQAKLETNLLQFNAGLELAQTKLQQWERGEYSKRDFWDPPASQRRAERAEREAERVAQEEAEQEEAAQKDQILTELDAWDEYVKSFIALYDLDEGQRATANTSLNEMKERALKHRNRYKEQIGRLEKEIDNQEGNEERLAALELKVAELYGPIDQMFEELKDRLSKIPTEQQKTRVAELQAKQPKVEDDKETTSDAPAENGTPPAEPAD